MSETDTMLVAANPVYGAQAVYGMGRNDKQKRNGRIAREDWEDPAQEANPSPEWIISHPDTTHQGGYGPDDIRRAQMESGSDWHASLEEMPTLSLTPYEGRTDVPLSPALQRTLSLTDRVLNSPQYGEMLNPEPNYEDMMSVYNMSRRNQELYTKPAIEASYSGGPYGSAYQSGAAKDALMSADVALNDAYQRALIDERRYEEQLSLQAAGFLPVATNIQSIAQQNEIANLNRKMSVHYSNEGLKVAEFNADLAAINAALGVSSFEFNKEMSLEQLKMQQEAQDKANQTAMYSAVGGIAGAGIGMGMGGGPIGGMVGYSMGSSLGGMMGGSPAYAYPYSQQGAMSAMEMYYLSTMNKGGGTGGIYPNPGQSVGFGAQPSGFGVGSTGVPSWGVGA